MIRKLLSYLFPIDIEVIPSNVSEQLELTWINGKLVLDTKNTNYSFGNLQKVLRKGLQKIGSQNINQMDHILVLGVAGGSVIQTLTKEFGYKKKITGIELDPVVVKIAEKHFALNKVTNLNVIIVDAEKYVSETNLLFDLIIIDVFQDYQMPKFLFSEGFTLNIKRILKPKGFILFNTIILNDKNKANNTTFKKQFEFNKYNIQSFPNINDKNELILISKEYE